MNILKCNALPVQPKRPRNYLYLNIRRSQEMGHIALLYEVDCKSTETPLPLNLKLPIPYQELAVSSSITKAY